MARVQAVNGKRVWMIVAQSKAADGSVGPCVAHRSDVEKWHAQILGQSLRCRVVEPYLSPLITESVCLRLAHQQRLGECERRCVLFTAGQRLRRAEQHHALRRHAVSRRTFLQHAVQRVPQVVRWKSIDGRAGAPIEDRGDVDTGREHQEIRVVHSARCPLVEQRGAGQPRTRTKRVDLHA